MSQKETQARSLAEMMAKDAEDMINTAKYPVEVLSPELPELIAKVTPHVSLALCGCDYDTFKEIATGAPETWPMASVGHALNIIEVAPMYVWGSTLPEALAEFERVRSVTKPMADKWNEMVSAIQAAAYAKHKPEAPKKGVFKVSKNKHKA